MGILCFSVVCDYIYIIDYYYYCYYYHNQRPCYHRYAGHLQLYT
jgi:hypothetical protein